MSGDNNEAIEAYDKYRTQVEEASDYIEHFDILETITNVGNDEVFTPAAVCRRILDALPEDVWKHPEYKWLNPCTKNGIFEREIAIRLNESLADQIPDEETRKKHILQEMIFSIGVTRFCSMVARRTLYYCAYANRADDGIVDPVDGHSVNGYAIGNGTWFNDEQGNIKTPTAEHYFGKDGKCIHCKISKDSKYTDESQIEHYAYEFIHSTNATYHLSNLFGRQNMKFDVIIGNPPYQLNDGGSGASAKPIYNLFIERAKELKPRYIAMIIPARWYAGGKGLDKFRDRMLHDKHIRILMDYPNGKDCFPNFSIGGGVCYFVWDSKHNDDCQYYQTINGDVEGPVSRKLDEFSVFVRYNESLKILEKVRVKQKGYFNTIVSTRNPFGLESKVRGKNSDDGGCLKLWSSDGESFIPRNSVDSKIVYIDKWKILLSKLSAEHANEPDADGKYRILSSLKLLAPGEVCTDSYLVAGKFDTKGEAENCFGYMKTKFVRFLVMQAVSSINITRDCFSFVPLMDYSKKWTDEDLNSYFELTTDEVQFINSLIREF